MATEGCDWKFIPPYGPHFGVLWEVAVKSMKYHLLRILGAQIATYEELCTLLNEIEAYLNSRALCALSDDPFNRKYLSPGHFLIGEPLTQLPAADLTDVKCNRLSRWQSFQQLQQFWHRWSSDYLHSLQQRQRWLKTSPNVQPGALVLLREDNTTPLHWPTAGSPTSIQAKMASFALSHFVPPREYLNVQLQKFVPYRVQMMNYSVSVFWGSQYVHARANFVLLFMYNLCSSFIFHEFRFMLKN